MWFEHSGFPDPAPDHCFEGKVNPRKGRAGLGFISLGRNVNVVCDAYNVQLSVDVPLLTMFAAVNGKYADSMEASNGGDCFRNVL